MVLSKESTRQRMNLFQPYTTENATQMDEYPNVSDTIIKLHKEHSVLMTLG